MIHIHINKWTVTGGLWKTSTRRTFKKPHRVSYDADKDRFVFEREFEKVQGKDSDGNALFKVRVVTERDGTLVTSFPQLNWK